MVKDNIKNITFAEAYKKTGRIFVTGKHWGKLFEIELVKK